MKVIGIDPSIQECAAAALEGDDRQHKMTDLWRIKPDGSRLASKILSLSNQIADILEALDPDVMVVEAPSETSGARGGYFRRSLDTLPNYGAAVGAVMLACQWTRRRAAETLLLTPAANEWTRGLPSVRDDVYKESRVRYCRYYYGEAINLGPKSKAGNVADALLLARWGIFRAHHGQYYLGAVEQLNGARAETQKLGAKAVSDLAPFAWKIERTRVVVFTREQDGTLKRHSEVQGAWPEELIKSIAKATGSVEAFIEQMRREALKPANEKVA